MIRGVILDLDGTVYMGRQAVPGAADFIRRLERDGVARLFVTNRANRTPALICEHLEGYGIPCRERDVLTSAQATAQALRPGRVYALGEEGLRLALEQAGHTVTGEAPDYVVVGFDRRFDYAKLETACRLIDEGARFVATNPDRGLKTDGGIAPGTGAIVAAVAAGSGVEPLVVGKPERLIMDLAVERLELPRDAVICVGDNIDTDVPAGERAGLRTALLLTGITAAEAVPAAAVQPTWVLPDYAALQALLDRENTAAP